VSADFVRVWLVRADVAEADLARLFDILDEDERARAAAFVHTRDRDRFIVAHGSVRLIVGAHLGAPPREIRWAHGQHGKPELAGSWTGARVNLSHSGDLSMVAISASRPVGVDIQQLVPGLDTNAMAARYFPPEEARFVATARDVDIRAGRFARLWARKEAVLKASGGRLMQGMRVPVRGSGPVHFGDQGPHRVSDVRAPQGFRAAVALAGGDGYRLTVRKWVMPELMSATSMAATDR
jgi:4'-phosphopantetheinyl transferase